MTTDSAGREKLALAEAIRVFEDLDYAKRWLAEPCRALGGIVPSSLLSTDDGLALVLRELMAIEHGLPI